MLIKCLFRCCCRVDRWLRSTRLVHLRRCRYGHNGPIWGHYAPLNGIRWFHYDESRRLHRLPSGLSSHGSHCQVCSNEGFFTVLELTLIISKTITSSELAKSLKGEGCGIVFGIIFFIGIAVEILIKIFATDVGVIISQVSDIILCCRSYWL